MTRDLQTEENNFYDSIVIAKTVWNVILAFLHFMELREKWVSFYYVNWQRVTSKCRNCHMSVCSKFSQLCFCQILFEFVNSWESYYKNKKGELFIETQCSIVCVTSVCMSCLLVCSSVKQNSSMYWAFTAWLAVADTLSSNSELF